MRPNNLTISRKIPIKMEAVQIFCKDMEKRHEQGNEQCTCTVYM